MSSVIEKYTSFMEKIAADQSHGYSQDNRWGNPDYDCSSLVITALERAGIKAKSAGATYTGNMAGVLTNLGFSNVVKKVTLSSGAGLKRGDILMYHKSGNIGHVAVYQGNGMIVHARGQSYGSPAPGDQGSEITSSSYYNAPWQYVFRYKATPVSGQSVGSVSSSYAGNCVVTMPELVSGNVGKYVKLAQYLLNKAGFRDGAGNKLAVDGEYGENTAAAVTKMQKKAGMKGIWFGTMSAASWKALFEASFKY